MSTLIRLPHLGYCLKMVDHPIKNKHVQSKTRNMHSYLGANNDLQCTDSDMSKLFFTFHKPMPIYSVICILLAVLLNMKPSKHLTCSTSFATNGLQEVTALDNNITDCSRRQAQAQTVLLGCTISSHEVTPSQLDYMINDPQLDTRSPNPILKNSNVSMSFVLMFFLDF